MAASRRASTISIPSSGVRFDSATYAVEAAVHGEGVLLGRSALVSADLAAGRLVRPFDLALKSRWKYYVVYPERRAAAEEGQGIPRLDLCRDAGCLA